jgi:signal transduction histidine kinase
MWVFVGIWNYFGSLAGRIALILTIGMSVASIGSLYAAESARDFLFGRYREERVAVSAADIAARFKRDPEHTREILISNRMIGAHLAKMGVTEPIVTEAGLKRSLDRRLGKDAGAVGFRAPVEACYSQPDPNSEAASRVAGFIPAVPECWVIGLRSHNGERIWIAFDLPPLYLPPRINSNPIFVFLIILACLILSIAVSRVAMAPLRRLTAGVKAFSRSVDAEPVPERGPRDVRAALVAFNAMQKEVRDGVRERTRMLAAISHDLQTPLTRMRLRLEKVEPKTLRERLITDLAAMRALVREGLDLARSEESSEKFELIDLDSLLSSVADDWVEMGHDVQFTEGCGAKARVKPDALVRCITNLVDNAVKYAGNAELRAFRRDAAFIVQVRDNGPGIPDAQLSRMFAPFVRGEQSRSRSTGGTGIGLSIARAQASTFGAQVALSNAPSGGLLADLIIATD